MTDTTAAEHGATGLTNLSRNARGHIIGRHRALLAMRRHGVDTYCDQEELLARAVVHTTDTQSAPIYDAHALQLALGG
jgi:hypothetical protein